MGRTRGRNQRMMRTLREHDRLVQILSLVSGVAALATRDVTIVAAWLVVFSLLFLWTVLSRSDDTLRKDFGDYGGGLGAPLAWMIAKLPGPGPRILGTLLALVVPGLVVYYVVVGPPPLGRAALAAKADAICNDFHAKVEAAAQTYSNPGDPVGAADAAIRKLKPTASAAGDWHAVIAGLDALNRSAARGTTRREQHRLDVLIAKGDAATKRLGIKCNNLP